MTETRQYPAIVHKAARAAYGALVGAALSETGCQGLAWDKTTPERRESVLDAAYNIYRHAVLPEDLHKQWMDRRHKEGWRYGVDRDHDAKTHPSLTGWRLLHGDSRAKFELFLTVCQIIYRQGAK